MQAGSVDRALLTSIIYSGWLFELYSQLHSLNFIVRTWVALSRESTSVLSGPLGSLRDRWGPSDVQTLRHVFLIIWNSNNIMVEEFGVISCYQSAPLFIAASLGGLMGLKPLGASDLKSNYAHSGEWLRKTECLLLFCLCSLQADQVFELTHGPSPQHISLKTLLVA